MRNSSVAVTGEAWTAAEQPSHELEVFGMHEVCGAQPDELLRLVLQQILDRRRHIAKIARLGRIIVTSEEFWMSDRKRSSLRSRVAWTSSFCSMMAPTIRMTKSSTNAPITVSAMVCDRVSSEGNQPCTRAH